MKQEKELQRKTSGSHCHVTCFRFSPRTRVSSTTVLTGGRDVAEMRAERSNHRSQLMA